jgi:hypothetical protein
LIPTAVKDSRDQDVSIVSIVDDVAFDDERANAFAEFGPVATRTRLFGQELESIEDGVNESIGRRGAGVLGNVGQISARSDSARADSR